MTETSSSKLVPKQSFRFAEQGQLLKQAREKAGLSSQELAGRVGVTRFAISKYERGEIVPSLVMREALAKVLGREKIEGIAWPRPNSPASYRRISKYAPPGSVGALLKEMRMKLPEPPNQFEIAVSLGMTEQAYRYLEGRGGSITPQLLEKLAQLYSSEQIEQLCKAEAVVDQ